MLSQKLLLKLQTQAATSTLAKNWLKIPSEPSRRRKKFNRHLMTIMLQISHWQHLLRLLLLRWAKRHKVKLKVLMKSCRRSRHKSRKTRLSLRNWVKHKRMGRSMLHLKLIKLMLLKSTLITMLKGLLLLVLVIDLSLPQTILRNQSCQNWKTWRFITIQSQQKVSKKDTLKLLQRRKQPQFKQRCKLQFKQRYKLQLKQRYKLLFKQRHKFLPQTVPKTKLNPLPRLKCKLLLLSLPQTALKMKHLCPLPRLKCKLWMQPQLLTRLRMLLSRRKRR